jgi:hypothetical protein
MKIRLFLLVLFSILIKNGVTAQTINHLPINISYSNQIAVARSVLLEDEIWLGCGILPTLYYSGSNWINNFGYHEIHGLAGARVNDQNIVYCYGKDNYASNERLYKWNDISKKWDKMPPMPYVGKNTAAISVLDENNVFILSNEVSADVGWSGTFILKFDGVNYTELCRGDYYPYATFLYADASKVIFSKNKFHNSDTLSCYLFEQDTVVNLATISNTTRIQDVKSVNGIDFFILTEEGHLYQYSMNTQTLTGLIICPEDEQFFFGNTLQVAGNNHLIFTAGNKGIRKVMITNDGEIISQIIYSTPDGQSINTSSLYGTNIIFGGTLSEILDGVAQYPFLLSIDYTTGVIETTLPDIHIFPNPSTDWIKIDGLKETSHVQIFDIAGKLVLSQECQIEETINISDLNAGMYIVHVQNSEGVYSTKLVKE